MIGLGIVEVRDANNGLAAFAVLSGVIFAFVGIGLFLTLRQGSRLKSADDALQQQFPDSPWLWRSDWASGHISSEGNSNALAFWLIAIIWNAIAWFAFYFIYFVPSEQGPSFEGVRYLSAILPLSGILLIVLAIVRSFRWLTMRGSYLDLASIPGGVGGELIGKIRMMPPSRANRELRLVLSCTTRPGSAEERELYRDEHTVRGSVFDGIAVNFQIPANLPASSDDDSDRVAWQLAVLSPASPRTSEAQFEVPVFNAQPRRPGAMAKASSGGHPENRSDGSGLAEQGGSPVRERVLPSGATEFYFPPCRAPAAAVGATLFTAGWSAMFLMILRIDAPIFFDLVWAGFDAFMLLWVASLWFGDTRVLIDNSSLEISRGIPGLTLLHHKIPANEVNSVTAVVGSRTGYTTYYRLKLAYGNNRKLLFGDRIGTRQAAESLARAIEDQVASA